MHVVILGLDRRDRVPRVKRLLSYPDINGEPIESQHSVLTPYLFDGSRLHNSHLVVTETNRRLNDLPQLISGSQPIDDRNYIFTSDDYSTFLADEPGAAAFMHPYIGSREYIHGQKKWILYLQDASPSQLRILPKVVERMRAVREFRLKSKRKSTLAIAQYPVQYNVAVIPKTSYLVIPKASLESREYVPIGWIEPPTIPSDLLFVLELPSKPLFVLLTSAMHMSWLRHIGGRLKSDYRYSIGLVYNTFPVPSVSQAELNHLEPLADAVLGARAEYPNATLAELYDPDLMPGNLRRAHRAVDQAVDRLYRRSGFLSERERVEHLFSLYELLVAPLTAQQKTVKKAATRRLKSAMPVTLGDKSGAAERGD